MKQTSVRPGFFIVFGVILGLGGFFLILANPFGWKTPIPYLKLDKIGNNTSSTASKTSRPVPVPTLVLPSGSQTFNVQGSNRFVSKVSQITLSPLDVKKGGTQTISMKVTSTDPITSFKITINSDNGSKETNLSLSSGTSKDGVYSAKVLYDDSVDKIYNMQITINTENKHLTQMPFPLR